MILSGQSIRKRGIFKPFSERTQFQGFSFGLSPAGYDVRIAEDILQLRPGEFILASTIERFEMPNDLMGIVHDKSTWARMGLAVQNTVIEPGWCGFVTLELTNHGSHDIRIPWSCGIAQIIFHQVDEPCEIAYDGKYQNQEAGPQAARFTK